MASLMDTILGSFSGDITRKAAAFLGESPENTQRAIHGAVPTIMAASLQKATSPGGARELFDLVTTASRDTNLLQNYSSMLGGGGSTDKLLSTGQGLLSSLLGSKSSAAASMLAGLSGMKASAVSTLLGLVTPLVIAFLGKETASRGLNPSGFVDFLLSQKNDIMRMAPPGLANVLGLSDLSRLGATASHTVTKKEESSGARWLLPLLATAALALIAWMLLRGGKTTEVAETPPNAADEAAQRADAFVDPAKDVAKAQKHTAIKLPDGATVDVLDGSFNHGLATFLSTATASQLPRSFVFDNLNFDTSQTHVTDDSQPTLHNLIAILKAYPSTSVRLEGHTDTTGDPMENQKLSMTRAETVKAALVAGGISAGRVADGGIRGHSPDGVERDGRWTGHESPDGAGRRQDLTKFEYTSRKHEGAARAVPFFSDGARQLPSNGGGSAGAGIPSVFSALLCAIMMRSNP